MLKLIGIALALVIASPAIAGEMHCGRVMCDARDGIMTYRGRFALVSVNPSRFRFTYACWEVFNTLAEAKAAQKAQGK
jgi:hypothetical protein